MGKLYNKIARINALKTGEGIKYLLEEAYKILKNPLIIHDMDYKLMVYTENIIVDDPLWNELVTNGCFCDKTIEFFKSEYFIDAVANTDTVTFLSSEQLKYDRIVGKVYNKNDITVANVILLLCNDKVYESDFFAIVEALCEKISRELSKIEFYQDYGNLYQNAMMKNLVNGDIHDKKLYSGHVANIYKGLKNNLYVAVVDIAQYEAEYTKLLHFKELYKNAQGKYKYFTYENYMVFIISSSNSSEESCQDKINKFFTRNKMNVGISSCFDNLFELRKYYLEAVDALEHKFENQQPVFEAGLQVDKRI